MNSVFRKISRYPNSLRMVSADDLLHILKCKKNVFRWLIDERQTKLVVPTNGMLINVNDRLLISLTSRCNSMITKKTQSLLLTGKTGTTSVCEFSTTDGRVGLLPGHVIINTGLPGMHCNKTISNFVKIP
jgi:hypothetical protein